MRQFHDFVGLTILLALAAPAFAQETRMVPVDDRAMRVQIAGLEQLGKVPLVIFESGGGGWSVAGWDPIFAEIAKAAPVIAYDRAGYGRSEPDGQPPTPRHNAEKLHRLLAQLKLKPPYVLVGHSWGGALIRMFAALYPGEIAGMIYLDPTDLHSREQEIEHLRAIGYTAEGAAGYVTRYRQEFTAYIATLPPVVQVEMKLIDGIERSDAPEFQRMPPAPSVPLDRPRRQARALDLERASVRARGVLRAPSRFSQAVAPTLDRQRQPRLNHCRYYERPRDSDRQPRARCRRDP